MRQLWCTWFHQVEHVSRLTSLLILERHYTQPIRFEGNVYSKCQVLAYNNGYGLSALLIHLSFICCCETSSG